MGYSTYYHMVLGWNPIGLVCGHTLLLCGIALSPPRFVMVSEPSPRLGPLIILGQLKKGTSHVRRSVKAMMYSAHHM